MPSLWAPVPLSPSRPGAPARGEQSSGGHPSREAVYKGYKKAVPFRVPLRVPLKVTIRVILYGFRVLSRG